MPQNKYTVQDPASGRIVVVEGDSPPTDADLDEIFASLPPEKSLAGFGSNLASSAGRFVTDTAKGAWELTKGLGKLIDAKSDPRKAQAMGDQLVAMLKASPEILRQLTDAGYERYGDWERIKQTAYEDPVGILSDLSTVVGAGAALKAAKAPAVVRLATKAGPTAAKVASAAGKIGEGAAVASEFTNPMKLPGYLGKKAAEEAGTLATQVGLRADAPLRREHGGSRRIAKTVVKEGITSAEDADRKMTASKAAADAIAKEAGAAGKTLDSELLIRAQQEPMRTAQARLRAAPSETADVEAIEKHIEGLKRDWLDPGRPEGPPTRIETPESPDPLEGLSRARTQLEPGAAERIPAPVMSPTDPVGFNAARQLGPMADLVPRRLLGAQPQPARVLEVASPAVPPSWKTMTPEQGMEMKRTSQNLAYERGKGAQTIGALSQSAQARGLKAALDELDPRMAPANQKTFDILGAKRAFERADKGAESLTSFALPRTLPQLGVGAGKAGALMANPRVQAVIMLMRNAGATQDEIDQALREMAAQQGRE